MTYATNKKDVTYNLDIKTATHETEEERESLRIRKIHSLVANNLKLNRLIIKAMTTKNLNGLN